MCQVQGHEFVRIPGVLTPRGRKVKLGLPDPTRPASLGSRTPTEKAEWTGCKYPFPQFILITTTLVRLTRFASAPQVSETKYRGLASIVVVSSASTGSNPEWPYSNKMVSPLKVTTLFLSRANASLPVFSAGKKFVAPSLLNDSGSLCTVHAWIPISNLSWNNTVELTL